MKYPVCGGAELLRDTRNITYSYKSKTTIYPSITGDFCPACTEIVLEIPEAERYRQLITDFHKQSKR